MLVKENNKGDFTANYTSLYIKYPYLESFIV